ncbi:MAG: cytochrome c [Deltaproteobacteria bacterium]|nr:cytochrome c [Deltaproteobacteria bacterium]
MKKPDGANPAKLLWFVVIVFIAYVIFKSPGWFMNKPIPGSLIMMYMFFAVVAALLVMTSTDESTQGLFAPIKALVEDPSKKIIRNAVFVIAPIVGALITYNQIKPGFDAPVELRATHPAPPTIMKAYDKTFNLATLENPFRKLQTENPEKFKEAVKEGGAVYFKNCFFCHGDKLDGKGHFAQGFNPLPLPFQGKDTIAQLQESFVFWRISTGGPGLPKEATPWLSAMPVWHTFLSEDEVWKAILFIYDYTDNAPRSWVSANSKKDG